MITDIQQAVDVLNEHGWRGRDDWRLRLFSETQEPLCCFSDPDNPEDEADWVGDRSIQLDPPDAIAIASWLQVSNAPAAEPSALIAQERASVDMLLFCPQCGEQHIDEAKPDVCETCGHDHPSCSCAEYKAWLNPPHKSHRCTFCNHVWRPADITTNGVSEICTRGSNDGSARPRYYCTAQDFKDAVASIAERLRQFQEQPK